MELHLDPRGPSPRPSSPRRPGSGQPGEGKRRSRVGRVLGGIGWLFGGGSDWSGASSIRRGFSLIGELARRSREPASGRERVYTHEDSTIDLEATAFSLGVNIHELRARLARRRREIARLSYLLAGLGVLCLLGWLRSALSSPLTASRIMLTIDFIPFCALFFLLAFYQALLNYQIRSGRQVGWRAFLMAEGDILPR